MKPFRYLAASVLILFACAPSLYLPTDEQAARVGIPLEELQQGRKLYVDNCGSCHMLYLPNRFTVDKWEAEMVIMRTKVTITDRDEELILKYLLTGK